MLGQEGKSRGDSARKAPEPTGQALSRVQTPRSTTAPDVDAGGVKPVPGRHPRGSPGGEL